MRCDSELGSGSMVVSAKASRPSTAARAIICLAVLFVMIAVFYLSLIASSRPLRADQRQLVVESMRVIREKGFETEAMLLENLCFFRSTDNWLNSLVPKENAFAATNFPFEIITIYPDFATYPVDEIERAAILLHEARHLQGGDEKDAYQFVWKNRSKLGWTKDKYSQSSVWRNVRRQTREYAPELFACPGNEFDDCTEF